MKRAKIALDKITLDGEWGERKTLTSSLANIGQLQPIIVCKIEGKDEYRIGGGRGRVVSARALGWETIDALIFETEGVMEFELARISLAENLHASNRLNEARAIAALTQSAGETGDEVWKLAGISKGGAKTRLKLLSLTRRFQVMLEKGKLTLSAAKELAKLAPDLQGAAWKTACSQQKGGKFPSAIQVRHAVRRELGKLQPRLSVPAVFAPGQDKQNGEQVEISRCPDPVQIAALLRAFCLSLTQDKATVHKTLEKAIEVLEAW